MPSGNKDIKNKTKAPPFSPEIAREMQKRAAAKRKENKSKREQEILVCFRKNMPVHTLILSLREIRVFVLRFRRILKHPRGFAAGVSDKVKNEKQKVY